MNCTRGKLPDINNVLRPTGPTVGLKIQWPHDVAQFRNHL